MNNWLRNLAIGVAITILVAICMIKLADLITESAEDKFEVVGNFHSSTISYITSSNPLEATQFFTGFFIMTSNPTPGYRTDGGLLFDGVWREFFQYEARGIWVGDFPPKGHLVKVVSKSGGVDGVVITDLSDGGREYRTAIKRVNELKYGYFYYQVKSYDSSGKQVCRVYAGGKNEFEAMDQRPAECMIPYGHATAEAINFLN